MFEYVVQHAFAGLWALIWHFGVGIGVIILLGVAAYFAPTLRMKVILVAFAIIVGALLVGEGIGVNMEKSHVVAQQQATTNFVDKTVKGTTTTKSRGLDDPWDRKDY